LLLFWYFYPFDNHLALFIVAMIGPAFADLKRIDVRKGRFNIFRQLNTVHNTEETGEKCVHPNEAISMALPVDVEQFEQWQLKKLFDKPALISTWQILPDENEVNLHNWMKMKIKYINNNSSK
jgi:hypothetical protein